LQHLRDRCDDGVALGIIIDPLDMKMDKAFAALQLRTRAECDKTTCIIPGNDLTHGSKTGEAAGRLMPDCESHSLGLEDQNVDIVPAEEWYKMADDIAAILNGFLMRKLPQTQPQTVRA